ncbi:unnamed protein product [Symbiodinium necroappetens]|uniref:Uncharacterized protein n=1 Tax=Symbiodinium necroappetens TaxID=1628268 RepID=A0A813A784_9DINO|nr:unnamed protein product [Symbiodinium necroappetens]
MPQCGRTTQPSQPSRVEQAPTLRRQILRVATETFAELSEDPIEEDEPEVPADVPAPSTLPFPPPTATNTESTADIHDVTVLIEKLRKVIGDSHGKTEVLLHQTSTLLATQHEAMTALIASCKQQLDVLESLLRQGNPDWS